MKGQIEIKRYNHLFRKKNTLYWKFYSI